MYLARLSEAAHLIIESDGTVVPRVHGAAKRASLWCLCPVGCGLCCVWSSLLRLIACPVQCLFIGPGYACSNNGCTNTTDECIVKCVKEINKPTEFIVFDIVKASKEDLAAAAYLAIQLLKQFECTVFNKKHYVLCEFVVRPLTGTLRTLPATAHGILSSFLFVVQEMFRAF